MADARVAQIISMLAASKTATSNNALYQAIFTLVQIIQDMQAKNDVQDISITDADKQDYITWRDDRASLANSRKLVAGTGCTLDLTVNGIAKITVP